MKDIGKLHGLELSPSSYFLFILLYYGKNENVYFFFRIRKCKKEKILYMKENNIIKIWHFLQVLYQIITNSTSSFTIHSNLYYLNLNTLNSIFEFCGESENFNL